MKNNNTYIKLACSFIMFILSLNIQAQLKVDTKVYKDKELIDWIEHYFIKHRYFYSKKDSMNPDTALTSKDINGQYAVFLIEKKKFGNSSITIYQIIAGEEANHPLLLIRKELKNQKSSFEIIGEKAELENLVRLYNFFSKHIAFSDSAKVICYERLIIDYNNSKLSPE